MIKSQLIDYQDGNTTLEAYCAFNDTPHHSMPVVMVVHDWSGKNKFACQKAEELAQLGYIGLAIDMYGKGKTGNTKEEKSALMMPLINDREKLQTRMLAGLQTALSLPNADTKRIAAIGFCFGGLCALDLARCSKVITGVISFHGLLGAPPHSTNNHISAKILALHGYNDPMVTHKDILAFGDEMTAAKADWQLHVYGNTMHAFTNPEANDPAFGTVYNKTSDLRSFRTMKDFLEEIFANQP